MKIATMIIGARLVEARKRAGLAQVDLAVALGARYDQPMISNVETGRRSLRLDGAVNAARELGVSLDYLVGLTDDPTPADLRNSASAVDDQHGAEDHIEQLAEVAAAAGGGAQVYDETVTATVPFRRDWLRRHRINPRCCNVISVRGESMEPTLPNGCSVIVDLSRTELRQGRIYVMSTEEGLVAKRVKQNAQGWWLLSDNPEWAPLMLTENTDVVGEVRWVARTLPGS